MFLQNRFLAFLFLTVCTLGAHAAAQQVKLSATSLTFGSHTPGNSSAPQTITLSNDGAADLSVGAIAASGGFSQSNDCATLHPGQSCTIDVTYISSIVGNSEGVLTINDNAASTPEIVTLTGTVLPPITFAPGTLSFGSIAVGTSQTKSVTITNNGSAFGIAAISTSGDYAQANNCPAILPAPGPTEPGQGFWQSRARMQGLRNLSPASLPLCREAERAARVPPRCLCSQLL